MLIVKFFLAAVLLAGQVEQRGESSEVRDLAAEGCQRSEIRGQGEQKAEVGGQEQQLVLLRQKSAELDRLQREVQELRAATGTAQQILVKVEMLEVQVTKLRQLGMDDWFSKGRIGRANVRHVAAAASESGEPSAAELAAAEAKSTTLFVDMLKQQGMARPLAEPNLVVLSGRPASFNVGGEVPVPSRDAAKAAVEFLKFGTAVDVLAVAKGGERVRLEVRARLSELDDTRAVEVNGVRVPALTVRECDTASEVAFGQSAVLSGLVQKRVESFKAKDGRVEEEVIEVGLLVVVTPEKVEDAKSE